jgi:hypothetical protein
MRIKYYSLEYLLKAALCASLFIVGSFVVSAALDDPDLEPSNEAGFNGRGTVTLGGGGGFSGGRAQHSHRQYLAAYGMPAMPEMAMPKEMARMSKPSAGATAGSRTRGDQHDASTSSFASPGSATLGAGILAEAPHAAFDPASVQTMLVRTGSVDISTDQVIRMQEQHLSTV